MVCTDRSAAAQQTPQQIRWFSMFGEEEKTSSQKKETITVPEHKRKKKRTHDELMSSLPVKEEHHEIKHPVCEICGSEMVEIGDEKAYDELFFSTA